jgi:SAM-dependent methyltransferase
MAGGLRGLKARAPRSIKRPARKFVNRVQRPLRRVMGPAFYRVFPGWHRERVGGNWERMGRHQFEFLVSHGLQPTHRFLDVGCGSLRGGLHFIRYLETGNYHGIDILEDLLRAGRFELKRAGLESKDPTLVRLTNFEFSELGPTFDYALAQSVFSHLNLNKIMQCVANMDRVLSPGGKFFATFHENPHGKFHLEPIAFDTSQRRRSPDEEGFLRTTHYDRDPYHYAFEVFEWVCEGTGLGVENLGDWGHPRNQRMLVFTKRA